LQPKGSTPEALKIKCGGSGSWEENIEPPAHKLGSLGEYCKLPQWGLGQSSGCLELSWHLLLRKQV